MQHILSTISIYNIGMINMKLSKKGEYALMAMIYLSFNKDRKVTIHEIADTEKIPVKFLEQILLELKKAGMLRSKTGSGGGYELLRDPGDINLAEVIRIIDGPLAPINCVSKRAYMKCPQENTCRLRDVMLNVRNSIAQILENVTFADLCKTK